MGHPLLCLEDLAEFSLIWKPDTLPRGRSLSVLFSRIPVHTLFDSCPEGNGIRSMAITRDAKLLATISDAEVQVMALRVGLLGLA